MTPALVSVSPRRRLRGSRFFPVPFRWRRAVRSPRLRRLCRHFNNLKSGRKPLQADPPPHPGQIAAIILEPSLMKRRSMPPATLVFLQARVSANQHGAFGDLRLREDRRRIWPGGGSSEFFGEAGPALSVHPSRRLAAGMRSCSRRSDDLISQHNLPRRHLQHQPRPGAVSLTFRDSTRRTMFTSVSSASSSPRLSRTIVKKYAGSGLRRQRRRHRA